MTVYVDGMQTHWPKDSKTRKYGTRWCHMFADTELELLAIASDLGLRKEWIQKSRGSITHFDLTESKRKRAIKMGVEKVSAKTYLIKLKDAADIVKIADAETAEKAKKEPKTEPELPKTAIHIHEKTQYEKGEGGAILLDRKKTIR